MDNDPSGNNGYKNFKFINTREACTSTLRLCPTLQNNRDLPSRAYSHDELLLVNNATKHDQKYKILLFGAIRAIRSLKLNCKKVKNSKPHNILQTGVNLCNLIQITRLPAIQDCRHKIATVNTQPIRNKNLQVSELISDHNLDSVVVTETWFTNNQSDNIWLEGTCLNKDHLRMLMNNRVGQKGVDIALIYMKECSVKITKNGTKSSFQYSVWSVNARNKHLTISGLYHPPYSPMNPTNNIFIDEITELLTEVLPSSKNYIILQDLKLYVSDQDDTGAQIFSDSMEVLGLKQHLMIPTHKSNNVLVLIFSEIISDISVEAVETASYISDHCLVIATLNIKKEQVEYKESSTKLLKLVQMIEPGV